MLAIATTLFAFFCPEPIKEATETRWARELNQSVLEYRSAKYAHPVMRHACLVLFTVGGGCSLLYLLWRGAIALVFLYGL
ncbi:MAG: hypothetical protein L0Z53_07060 [Acidobacteriales bacterium]|nr:hypothetical protein [Terriglobales bacterium]